MTRTINLDKVAEQVDHYAYIARVIARRETDGDEKRRLLLSLAKEMRDLAGNLEIAAAAIPREVQRV